GKAKLIYGGNETPYNGELETYSFYPTTYSFEPTVVLPSGYSFKGWQVYSVNGSTETKVGGVIAQGKLTEEAVAQVGSGESIRIVALVNYPPVITANTLEKYVGDSFNLIEGITAKDASGADITLNVTPGALKNVEVSHSIPNDEGKYDEAGTYEVSIKVTDLLTNTFTTTTRIVKVHEGPSVVATPQEYILGDVGIESGVEGNASASWKEAGVNVGDTLTNITIDSTEISYSIKEGPSDDFSKIGIYKVTYTADNRIGKTGSKTVDVVITNVPFDTNNISLDAENFVLTQDELSTFDNDKAKDKNKGNVNAFYRELDNSNNVIGYKEITGDVTSNTAQLEAIKKASEAGGFFDLTYDVTENNVTSTKLVKVVVEGTQTVIEATTDDYLAINANGFTIENNEAIGLTDIDSITKSNAQAMLVKEGTSITDFTINANDLLAIQSCGEAGGLYNVRIMATYTDSNNSVITAETSVTVIVKGVQAVVEPTTDGQTLGIIGEGFIVSVDEAKALNKQDALTNAQIQAIIVETGITVNDISIDKNQLNAITNVDYNGGVFELTYSAKYEDSDGNITEKAVTVNVFVIPENSVVDPTETLIINANSFAVENEEAKDVDTNVAMIEGNTVAYEVIRDINGIIIRIDVITSGVIVENTQLIDINLAPKTGGLYPLSYSVTNTDNITVEKEVIVFVKPKFLNVDDNVTITLGANGFTLTQEEAKDLDSLLAIQNGNALATKTLTDSYGVVVGYESISANITVDNEQLIAFNNVDETGGVFPLIYTIEEDGIIVEKIVYVTIEGTRTPPPVDNEDDDDLAITANDFTIPFKDANALTQVLATQNAKAKAVLVSSGTILEINTNIEQLKTIQSASKDGGVFDLTFTATYVDENGKAYTISTNIKVTVLPAEKETITPTSTDNSTNVSTGDNTNTSIYFFLLVLMGGYITTQKKRKELLKQ
ncbi:MAG: hypothetical protein ACK5LC_02850, partial [Coprobacillaceae bacterium]